MTRPVQTNKQEYQTRDQDRNFSNFRSAYHSDRSRWQDSPLLGRLTSVMNHRCRETTIMLHRETWHAKTTITTTTTTNNNNNSRIPAGVEVCMAGAKMDYTYRQRVIRCVKIGWNRGADRRPGNPLRLRGTPEEVPPMKKV